MSAFLAPLPPTSGRFNLVCRPLSPHCAVGQFSSTNNPLGAQSAPTRRLLPVAPRRPHLQRSKTATIPINNMYPLNAIANWTSQVNHTVPNSPAAIWYEAASECPADDDGQRSGSESSSISVPPLAQPGDKFSKVARPPNAWILYRSDKLVEYRKLNPEMYEKMSRSKADRGIRPTQANMSKTIAEWWAKEPQSVKDHYHKEATARSVRHQAEYPGACCKIAVFDAQS